MSNSGPSASGHARGEHGKQVHAEAHIAGLDDGRVTRGGLDLGFVGRAKPGRADDMHDAGLRRECRRSDRRRRAGEIEHAVDIGEDGAGDRR